MLEATVKFLFHQKIMIFHRDKQNNNLHYGIRPLSTEYQN